MYSMHGAGRIRERNGRFDWKGSVVGGVWNYGIQGLEGAEYLSLYADISGDCRGDSAFALSGTHDEGYAFGYRCRRDCGFAFLDQQGGNRAWRWHYANGQRHFSGSMGESGIIFDGIAVCGRCSIVFYSNQKKGERLQSAIFTLCTGGIFVSTIMKRKLSGSLTVEAAMILPLLLWVFGIAMSSGIQMYAECTDTAAAILEEPNLDVVKVFYRSQEIEDIIGNEN